LIKNETAELEAAMSSLSLESANSDEEDQINSNSNPQSNNNNNNNNFKGNLPVDSSSKISHVTHQEGPEWTDM